MRKVNLIILAAVALYLLAAPLALGQGGNPPASTKESGATSGKGMTAVEQTSKSGGNVEEQIKALHNEGRQAALKGDTSYLEKYLADDYVGVGGDGRMFTKDQTIQRRKSGAVKVASIDELAVKIRVYGDTAIVNSLASVKGTIDGKPISGDSRAMFVWTKWKGSWKEVAFQVTPVATATK